MFFSGCKSCIDISKEHETQPRPRTASDDWSDMLMLGQNRNIGNFPMIPTNKPVFHQKRITNDLGKKEDSE